MQTKTVVLTTIVKDGDSNAMRAFSKTMTEAAKRLGADIRIAQDWSPTTRRLPKTSKAEEFITPIARESKPAPRTAAPKPTAKRPSKPAPRTTRKPSRTMTASERFFEEVIVPRAKSKTHTCNERGCYKYGTSFTDKGWFGDDTHKGHVDISPAHR
jgi:hypothetical protein